MSESLAVFRFDCHLLMLGVSVFIFRTKNEFIFQTKKSIFKSLRLVKKETEIKIVIVTFRKATGSKHVFLQTTFCDVLATCCHETNNYFRPLFSLCYCRLNHKSVTWNHCIIQYCSPFFLGFAFTVALVKNCCLNN